MMLKIQLLSFVLTPCSLGSGDQHFEKTCCLRFVAIRASEMSVPTHRLLGYPKKTKIYKQ